MQSSTGAAISLLVYIVTVIGIHVLVVWPRHLKLRFLQTPLLIPTSCVPFVACLVLLSTTTISADDVRSALSGHYGLAPYQLVLLCLSISFIGASLRATGLWTWLTLHTVYRVGNSLKRLLAVVFLLSAGVAATGTGCSSLPALTLPVAYYAAASGVGPMPLLLAQFCAVAAFSSVSFIATPANIVMGEMADMAYGDFFKWLTMPVVAAGAVALFMVFVHYRRHMAQPLPVPPKIDLSLLLMDQIGASITTANLLGCLLLLALAPSLHWDEWLVALIFAGIQAVYNLMAAVMPSRLRGSSYEQRQRLKLELSRQGFRRTMSDEDIADLVLTTSSFTQLLGGSNHRSAGASNHSHGRMAPSPSQATLQPPPPQQQQARSGQFATPATRSNATGPCGGSRDDGARSPLLHAPSMAIGRAGAESACPPWTPSQGARGQQPAAMPAAGHGGAGSSRRWASESGSQALPTAAPGPASDLDRDLGPELETQGSLECAVELQRLLAHGSAGGYDAGPSPQLGGGGGSEPHGWAAQTSPPQLQQQPGPAPWAPALPAAASPGRAGEPSDVVRRKHSGTIPRSDTGSTTDSGSAHTAGEPHAAAGTAPAAAAGKGFAYPTLSPHRCQSAPYLARSSAPGAAGAARPGQLNPHPHPHPQRSDTAYVIDHTVGEAAGVLLLAHAIRTAPQQQQQQPQLQPSPVSSARSSALWPMPFTLGTPPAPNTAAAGRPPSPGLTPLHAPAASDQRPLSAPPAGPAAAAGTPSSSLPAGPQSGTGRGRWTWFSPGPCASSSARLSGSGVAAAAAARASWAAARSPSLQHAPPTSNSSERALLLSTSWVRSDSSRRSKSPPAHKAASGRFAPAAPPHAEALQAAAAHAPAEAAALPFAAGGGAFSALPTRGSGGSRSASSTDGSCASLGGGGSGASWDVIAMAHLMHTPEPSVLGPVWALPWNALLSMLCLLVAAEALRVHGWVEALATLLRAMSANAGGSVAAAVFGVGFLAAAMAAALGSQPAAVLLAMACAQAAPAMGRASARGMQVGLVLGVNLGSAAVVVSSPLGVVWAQTLQHLGLGLRRLGARRVGGAWGSVLPKLLLGCVLGLALGLCALWLQVMMLGA